MCTDFFLCFLRSNVELLAERCQTVGLPQPKYDYQLGRDNKQRAVITLANGHRFTGCYTQNSDQAAELAAGIALTKLVSNYLNSSHLSKTTL